MNEFANGIRKRRVPWAQAEGGLAVFLCLLIACDRQPGNAPSPANSVHNHQDVASTLPQVDQRLCTGIVLLVDTSGSMEQEVPSRAGSARSKDEIAREAIQRIIAYTDSWKAQHPDRSLRFGIHSFSSAAVQQLEIAEFNAESANAAVSRLPAPAGGTAIGAAIRAGFESLYAAGCVRKYVVCITDGENTSGPKPERVARALHRETGGDVEMYFVAFDTSARHFAFLQDVNGSVVEAADGAQLDAQLADIYERRILAEEMNLESP
ncbi:MAG: VWA domain-containing protein [Phycisphaerae bacterium]